MTGRRKICLTFVGDVRKDSRATRFLSSLSERHEVTAVTLGPDGDLFTYAGARIQQFARTNPYSLRASLAAFWKQGRTSSVAKDADVYFASDLYSLPLASSAARNNRGKLLYDSRELYSSIAVLSERKFTQWFWTALERMHIRRTSAITTVNESIARILSTRYPKKKVAVLHNYPRRSVPVGSNTIRERAQLPDDVVILLSQGGLQRGRGAFILVDAIRHLSQCHLVFLGDGPLLESINRRAKEQGVMDRVHHIPAVPVVELPGWTASADIGACIIENLGRSYYLSLPNKLFEYIAAGLPVLGSRFPEIAGVIDSSHVGLTVEPENPAEVHDALKKLVMERGVREKFAERSRAVRDEFLWEKEGEKLHRLVEEALS